MPADGGTYTLLVELARPATVRFGAAGERDLAAGWYAYTGSALGPGGFARLDRHRRIADGGDVRHWHVDYLLGHPEASIADDVRSPGDAECAVARAIGGDPVPGIGASDCDCDTHLAYAPARDRLSVERAHAAATDRFK